MEPTGMKTVSSSTPAISSRISDTSGVLDPVAGGLDSVGGIPVGRALIAIGEPETTMELAQRLAPTVAMLWADVTAVDLFLPEGRTGELRGVRDPRGGAELLDAVASPGGGHAGVRVIPVTPRVVAGGPGRGAALSAPIVSGGD